MIAYHNTNAEFTKFSRDFAGKSDYGYAGKGFYFTSKPISGAYGNRTLKVNLDLRSPLRRTDENWNKSDFFPYRWISNRTEQLQSEGLNFSDAKKLAAKQWTEEAIKRGYDGFIDECSGGGEIVAFYPEQIEILEATVRKNQVRKNPSAIKLDHEYIEQIADELVRFVADAPKVIEQKVDDLKVDKIVFTNNEDLKEGKKRILERMSAYPTVRNILIMAYESLYGFGKSQIDTGIKIRVKIAHKNNITFYAPIMLQLIEKKSKNNIIFCSAAAAFSKDKSLIKKGTPIGIIQLDALGKNIFPNLNDKYVADKLKNEIVWFLSHEITHLSDYFAHTESPTYDADAIAYSKEQLDSISKDYYNAKTEVKARINQFFTLVRLTPDKWKNFDSFINHIKKEPFWKYYTEENKRYTISAMYAEWEKFFSKPIQPTRFQQLKSKLSVNQSSLSRYLSSCF